MRFICIILNSKNPYQFSMKSDNNYEFFKKSYDFLKLVRTEIKNRKENYGKEDSKTLRRYYSDWIKRKKYFDYVIQYTALRHKHLLKILKKGMKVLDTGCGTGTEVILYGVNGAEVLGIDISSARLKLAQKRKNYYEKLLKTKLNINFKLKNVFTISGSFDVIWVNEAISHIHPFDDFIRFCYNRLKDGGRLIIADTNKLNPVFFYRAKKEQKKSGGIITVKKDPSTNKDILYAVERIFTIFQIRSLISEIFNEIKVYPIGYIPFSFYNKFPNFTRKMEEIIQCIPIIKNFSGSYTLECKKSEKIN